MPSQNRLFSCDVWDYHLRVFGTDFPSRLESLQKSSGNYAGQRRRPSGWMTQYWLLVAPGTYNVTLISPYCQPLKMIQVVLNPGRFGKLVCGRQAIGNACRAAIDVQL